MSHADHLIALAEDQLTEYSTEARKIEKLRPKYGLAVPYPQQKAAREAIAAMIPDNFVAQVVAENRQTVALPFWGIGGLGLLFGISMFQPFDLLLAGAGFYGAIAIQRWGWKLEAKHLAIKTLDTIEASLAADRAEAKAAES